MLLYCPPLTAGFFSFSRRWRPTATIAKQSLYASMNHDSRYDVVSFVSIAESLVANLYFHHFPLAEPPALLTSTRRHPLSSDILLRRLLDLTERARRTPSALSRVRPPFDGDSPGGSTNSATARERRQGVHAVAVVMATTHSAANNDVRQASGRRVLLDSPFTIS